MINLNSVAVYTDLSPASAEAVRAAHAIARAVHAALEVVRVVAEPLSSDWTSELSTAGMPAVQDAMDVELRDWLASALGENGAAGVGLRVETGDPAEEIARYAREERPDLLVVAVGPGGGDRVDMVQQVVADAPCSVLAVRGPLPGIV